MEIYFLKSASCLAILLLFYKLLLEKEKMHVFKRFYLLAIPIISFGIPAISFPEYVVISSEPSGYFNEIRFTTETAEFPILEALAIGIYFMGVLFFGSRFILNLSGLLKKAKANPKIELPSATQVLVQEMVNPYTFWSYIYLNREKFQKKQIPQEVMNHELAHVRQKHSADILFVEILQVIFWFIPLIFLLKKAIKLNHEFLADSAVLKKTENVGLYQQILLSFSSGEQNNLVNSINYQSIKKRFTVMKKQPSQKAILVRYLLFLPLLAGLLYSFSSTETIVQIERNVASPENQKTVDIGSLNNVDTSQDQEKATPKMVREYNELTRHYKKTGITAEDVESDNFRRMKYIYSLMTPKQKKGAESFPPPPPPTVKQKDRAAMKQEREIKEERKAQRQEREMERTEQRELELERRAEKRELEVEIRRANEDIPPPPPPPAPPIEGDQVVPPPPPAPQHVKVPAPPPPPPSPEEAVKGWIEEGADFYLNGKKVSGKEALQAVQEHNGKNLSVQVEENASGKTVKLSTKKKKKNPQQASKNLKSGNLKSTFIGPPQEQDLLKANC